MTDYEHPSNALPQGHRLHEYELVRVLGSGGFGITYLGFDDNLDKAVAIKEYLPSDLATRTTDGSVAPQASTFRGDFQEGLKRFLDEARTLARFDHRHIIKVHRRFEAHGTAYIVMEYAEGETLSELLKRKGTLTEAELKKILYPILDGLEVVHRADFLHRDIKPANIVLRDEDDLPVLLDFGAARQAIGAKSRSIAAIVTSGYAPIEQYSEGGHQGPWTDIYALGAVCYRALTGRVPDLATDRVRHDPLVPVSQRCAGRVSGAFLSAIDAALAVDEGARPQSIGGWREMLEADAADAEDAEEQAALEKQRQEEQAALEQQRREQAAVERQRREQAAEEARLAAEQAEKQRREQAALDKQRREDQAVLKKAGVYSLHDAASKNAAEAAEVLLRQGADANAKGSYGQTPLHDAGSSNALATAEVLLKQGADANAKNEYGDTPLHRAAASAAAEAAEVLLKQGADANAKNEYGDTPLHNAAYKDASEAAEVLLKHGADIQATDNNGNTPLHDAAWNNATEAIESLIQHGADIQAKDNNGNTPLHRAAWKHATEAIESLIQHGADIQAKNNNGHTPLHRAAWTNATEAIESLIQHGADIQAKDNNGNTPRQIWQDAAARRGESQCY